MAYSWYLLDFQHIYLLTLQLHNNFHIRNQMRSEGSINSALARALETHEGTSEEVDSSVICLCNVNLKLVSFLKGI